MCERLILWASRCAPAFGSWHHTGVSTVINSTRHNSFHIFLMSPTLTFSLCSSVSLFLFVSLTPCLAVPVVCNKGNMKSQFWGAAEELHSQFSFPFTSFLKANLSQVLMLYIHVIWVHLHVLPPVPQVIWPPLILTACFNTHVSFSFTHLWSTLGRKKISALP